MVHYTGKKTWSDFISMSIDIQKYDLYAFFTSFFNTKKYDEKQIPLWLKSQFKYHNGKLQYNSKGEKL